MSNTKTADAVYAEGFSDHRLHPSTISRIPKSLKTKLEDDEHPLTYIPDAYHLSGCGIRQSWERERKERRRQELRELDERTIASSPILYPHRDIPMEIPTGGTGGGNQPESTRLCPRCMNLLIPPARPHQTCPACSTSLNRSPNQPRPQTVWTILPQTNTRARIQNLILTPVSSKTLRCGSSENAAGAAHTEAMDARSDWPISA